MLGQILKETREAAGLTQEALALAAGVDRSYVSQLERDKKSPTIQMLFRLCPPMKVKPSQLIARLERGD
ncbi:helix-turn-helix domain-containing protein [bacterium]|nr:helix-turn-helix domain-containing protein [bacterium]MBI1349297.1 helix-turn-helix domain-containing protein [bacterium]